MSVFRFPDPPWGRAKNPFGLTCTKIAKRGLVQILPTYLPTQILPTSLPKNGKSMFFFKSGLPKSWIFDFLYRFFSHEKVAKPQTSVNLPDLLTVYGVTSRFFLENNTPPEYSRMEPVRIFGPISALQGYDLGSSPPGLSKTI